MKEEVFLHVSSFSAIMASAKGCETVKSEEALIAEARKAFKEVKQMNNCIYHNTGSEMIMCRNLAETPPFAAWPRAA